MKPFLCHGITAYTSLAVGLALLLNSPITLAQSAEQKADQDSAYTRGKTALAARDGQTAITEFSQCLNEQPQNVECHWELGWSFFLTHDYKKAHAAWLTVKRMTPKRPGLAKVLNTINKHLVLTTQAQALRAASPPSFAATATGTSIKIHAVGDTMLGTNFPHNLLPPDNTSPLEKITPLLKGADITFANYEGTLCDGGESEKCAMPVNRGATASKVASNCFAFRSPRKFATQIRDAGFDVISLANNHILDFGEECRDQSEKILDDLGIAWSGRQGTVARFERQAIPFSFIAFHSALHANTTLDTEMAQDMVAAEKALGRQVIVSFHGGAEGLQAMHVPNKTEVFMGENRGHVRRFARAVVDAGADIVLGSGPHVVRGMEVYKDRLIAYSLGNFATYRVFNIWGLNGIGLILEAELDDTGRFIAGKIIPTRQTGFGTPVLDEKMIAIDVIRVLSQQDFPDSGVLIAQDGTLQKKHNMQPD